MQSDYLQIAGPIDTNWGSFERLQSCLIPSVSSMT
uniref:Uncharacterized protein n=1 Tax=Anguilla anguilla TaxID=7936 RepID=A0A0E9U2N0_ANGAN